MIKLTRYLGFYPDTNNKQYTSFDLEQGFYSDSEIGGYLLKEKELESFNDILGTNFDASNELTLSSMQRTKLLDNIILYYKLHIENFGSIKSLDVLRKIFE